MDVSTILLHVLKYLCRLYCANGNHVKIKRSYCLKCYWICKLCQSKSYHLSYYYTDQKTSLCIHHFISSHIYLVHYWRAQQLTLFNTLTNNKSTITIDKHIDTFAESIAFFQRIFVIGGAYPDGNDDTFEIAWKSKNTITKMNMLAKKCFHSLCCDISYIYTIGGYSSAILNDAQKYSVAQNKWIKLPDLQSCRWCSAVFVFNKDIYAIGGYGANSIDVSVEKINPINDLSWQYIKLDGSFTPRYMAHGIEVNSKQVLLFGGNSTETKIECNLLTICSNISSKRVANLMEGGEFYCSAAPICDGESVYAIDLNRNIHRYSLKKGSWTIIHDT